MPHVLTIPKVGANEDHRWTGGDKAVDPDKKPNSPQGIEEAGAVIGQCLF